MPGDSTINVASTTGGFAATYGVLSIDDELIVYTGKTAAQFTGCQRGAFGTAAATHTNGGAVKANMVAGFITALQSAVLAIENELGTAAARNYIRKDGAVTVTGLKTFQDGAEFGTGTKSSTGLVRLPNAGAIKWRKQDNSGDPRQRLDHVAGRPDRRDAHDVVAAVQGDRDDDRRRDRALGGDRPLHGWLDVGPRVPCVGRVPPAGQRSEARVRQDVGLPDRAGARGSGVRANRHLRSQQHGLSVQGARSRFESRGPHAPRGDGGRRTDHRGRHRQRVSARGD